MKQDHGEAEARRYWANKERDNLKDFFADPAERDVSIFYELEKIKENLWFGNAMSIGMMLTALACFVVLALILWRVW